jgi:hypothetical protein
MSLPLVLRRKARADFDEAVDWYEAQRLGLGGEFVDRVRAVFKTISEMPELQATIYRDIRKMQVSPFPYPVFFAFAEVGSLFTPCSITSVSRRSGNPGLERRISPMHCSALEVSSCRA